MKDPIVRVEIHHIQKGIEGGRHPRGMGLDGPFGPPGGAGSVMEAENVLDADFQFPSRGWRAPD